MIETPIGPLTVLVDDDNSAIIAIAFPDTRYATPRGAQAAGVMTGPLVLEAERQLRAYFAKQLARFDLPLAPRGTEYQRRVWSALAGIPPGTTTSYGALATALSSSARAVGTANGSNPIAVVIPCHRVVGKNGDLIGYGGGLPRKRWLLVHEGAALA